MGMTTREAYDKALDALNAHDINALAETWADDCVQTAPGDVRVEGKVAVVEFFRGWTAAFPDWHAENTWLLVVDDVVVSEGIWSGTHDGVLRTPTGDIAPTGRAAKVEFMEVHRFRDGKRVSSHVMFDQLTLLEQLGLMPAG
jgi:ketosteroid isomerase-like protein